AGGFISRRSDQILPQTAARVPMKEYAHSPRPYPTWAVPVAGYPARPEGAARSKTAADVTMVTGFAFQQEAPWRVRGSWGDSDLRRRPGIPGRSQASNLKAARARAVFSARRAGRGHIDDRLSAPRGRNCRGGLLDSQPQCRIRPAAEAPDDDGTRLRIAQLPGVFVRALC